MTHQERARRWLSDTPYLSIHLGDPGNLPLRIGDDETTGSLAAEFSAVERDTIRRCVKVALLTPESRKHSLRQGIISALELLLEEEGRKT